MTDTECKCFINGKKVYFVGCGDFIVFSKWANGCYEFRRVIGNEDVYIPTTTENIGSEEFGKEITRITAEEKNLLSPYYYNTLVGVDSLSDQDKATYYLDSKDDIEQIIINNNIVLSKKTGTDTQGGKYEKGDTIKNLAITISIGAVGPVSAQDVKSLGGFTFQVNYNLPDILIARFEGGAQLIVKRDMETAQATVLRGDGQNYTYNRPTKAIHSLVYKDYQNNETKIKAYSQIVTITNEGVTHSSSYGWTVFVDYSIASFYMNINCDLTEYSPILEEAYCDLKWAQTINYGFANTTNDYTASYDEGVLTFNAVKDKEDAYKPLVPEKPNIKIKLRQSINTNEETFKSITLANTFGLQGASDRLFVITDNLVRWSKDLDFTYFGEKSWCACGTADKKITGLDRLNDSTLLIAKEYSSQEPSIFVISGNIVTGKTEADTVDYTALFTPKGFRVSMGAVGEVVNFNGDCLMVAKDGLYAISLGENMTVDSRYILHRSRQISNTLEKFDLSKAKCISIDGRLYVAIDGECYVADNKYTASFKGDMPNAVNYEWWRWTNIPVSVWGVINNELCFGTEDGQVCSFGKNYVDETKYFLGSPLITYDYDVSDDDNIDANDKINGFTVHESIFNLIQDGDSFVADCNFKIDGKSYIGQTLYVKKKDNNVIAITDIDGKEMIGDSVESGNVSTNDFRVTITHKNVVVAIWQSGEMDLGTRAYSKSLTMFSITGEKALANRLKYKIKHRLGASNYGLLRANNDVDLSLLDLESFSLDSEFGSSFNKKLYMRNVNFIQLFFASDVPSDLAINSVQVEFKLYKKNIGVR
ncbi:MAG: hypothetical protein IKA85_06755 [Clostridia bacterium]|nr:hypothetical protein [Clostridia bacterium]